MQLSGRLQEDDRESKLAKFKLNKTFENLYAAFFFFFWITPCIMVLDGHINVRARPKNWAGQYISQY